MIKFFIFGIIFSLIGIPVLYSLADLFTNWITVLSNKACEISAKITKKIDQDNIHDPIPIGFHLPEENFEEEEDYE